MKNGKHFFDQPRNIKFMLRVFYAICLALFAADFVYRRDITHAFESTPGFYALFGLGACVALVLAAKEMRKVLMRDEDFYERGDGAGDVAGAGDGDVDGAGDVADHRDGAGADHRDGANPHDNHA